MSGIPDLDKFDELCPSVVTFEPRTLNLEPINIGMSLCEHTLIIISTPPDSCFLTKD
jgi:hypothetical protein